MTFQHDASEINVGVLPALSPGANPGGMLEFCAALIRDIAGELERATGLPWRFHVEEPTRLASDEPHRPSDFFDEGTLRMAEGPYDAVLVVTDAALLSRRLRIEPGLASPVSHLAVLSTRRLTASPRGQPLWPLSSEPVRLNAAALALHLIGHLLDLPHRRSPGDVMHPFSFNAGRTQVPRFSGTGDMRRRAAGLPERELRDAGALRGLAFHLAMASIHPVKVLRPLLRNRAPLLPLALPGLATAAVAPTLLLVFTAEIWDAGLGMAVRVVWIYAAASIVLATFYLLTVQNLFVPRKEKRTVTEHMAVVNVSIFLSMLLAVVGLFVMVAALMLIIETFIFPPGLIRTWPTLQNPTVTIWDKVRLAAFISTIGVTTGALAGGLESRAVIRHLALFLDEP